MVRFLLWFHILWCSQSIVGIFEVAAKSGLLLKFRYCEIIGGHNFFGLSSRYELCSTCAYYRLICCLFYIIRFCKFVGFLFFVFPVWFKSSFIVGNVRSFFMLSVMVLWCFFLGDILFLLYFFLMGP